jgi:hypothetical protein
VDNDEMLQLSGEFAALGAELHGDGDNLSALQRMVDLAVKYVPGCSWASVTVVERGKASTIAASDDVARAADQLQYSTGEGPCLASAREDKTYTVFDVRTEPRWPRFCAAVAERTPVHSVLSFELAAKESAALNLFGEVPGAFGDESLTAGSIFAAHVSSTVALYEAEVHAEHLQVALEGSREIGAAIGVLMSHHRVTQQVAFAMLSTASQQLNRKLRVVAGQVVETGDLPPRPISRISDTV